MGRYPPTIQFTRRPQAESGNLGYGLRNLFTFAISQAGSMFVNDVGQSAWEEVNDVESGGNFGWLTTEGPTTNPLFQNPRFAYSSAGNSAARSRGGSFMSDGTGVSQKNTTVIISSRTTVAARFSVRVATNEVEVFASDISSRLDLRVGADGAAYYLATGNRGCFCDFV